MKQIGYNVGKAAKKNWVISENFFDSRYLGKCEAIFCQGNGYLGVRNALEEKYATETRDTFVTGTFNKASAEEVTELPNLADMTAIKIVVDGYEMDLNKGKLKEYQRLFYLKNGESIRRITWQTPSNVKVKAVFRRFVSLDNEHLMASYLELSTNKAVAIKIITGIDGEVTNHGAQHFNLISRRVYDGKYMEYVAKTTESKVVTAQHCLCKISAFDKAIPIMDRRTLQMQYSVEAEPNQKISFEKVSLVHTGRDQIYSGVSALDLEEKIKVDGLMLLKKAEPKSYQVLLKESTKAWEKYWKKSDIEIDGDDYAQLAVRFALYHLRIMVKAEDNRVGIGAKALTGEGYKGHSFWDTEIFILPFFIFCHPQIARNLLEYRYQILPGARKKAKIFGYQGAMFPWESAWIEDGEVTPEYVGADIVTGELTKVWTGFIEHHISADIAFAVQQYWEVTGDKDFMEKYGYEIILDTALFWLSRLEYNVQKDIYEINDVIGPDEYKEHVNNNAYTNYLAHYNIELANKILKYLKEYNPALCQEIKARVDLEYLEEQVKVKLDKIYLPQPNEDGIIPQTDHYLKLKQMDLSKYKNAEEVLTIYQDFNTRQLNEYMVSKQADTVLLLLLLEEKFALETKRKNFVFYEDKTLHDSSLSRCSHAILANDLGLKDMAEALYHKALNIDLGESMTSSNEGIHSASIGGIWQSTIFGFGGVRVENGIVRLAPSLHRHWKKLKFILTIKQNDIYITATPQSLEIKNHGKNSVTLKVYEDIVEVEPFSTMTFRKDIDENI